MYFDLNKSLKNGQYWFVIKSLGNHQTLATSEMYVRKESAVHAIQIVGSSKDSKYYDKTGE